MAATVSTNAASTGKSIGSPRLPPRRASSGSARTSSPTWKQIVCGAGPEAEALFAHPPPPPPSSESLATALVPEFGYDVSSSGQGKAGSSTEVFEAEVQPEGSENGNGSRKNTWNKQYNAALESGLVIGAVSWPTLSESTKGSPKPPSADSLKNPNDSPSQNHSNENLVIYALSSVEGWVAMEFFDLSEVVQAKKLVQMCNMAFSYYINKDINKFMQVFEPST